ncbi:MAG: hypothetical protein U9N42_07600 [Campylobacterota bacterium]|nr:hypothetical protein [Campylobacterota bacterium]
MDSIKYNDENLELIDDFIDVGYMAENIDVVNFYNEKKELRRSHSDKSMTLLVSFPNTNNGFHDEIIKLDEFMSHIQVDINCYLIFAGDCEDKIVLKNRLKKFELVCDKFDEFGSMYGTKLVSGSLENMLCKSLFLISKDGAVFHLDMPANLDTQIDLYKLQVELNKAYTSYNGVGCHG